MTSLDNEQLIDLYRFMALVRYARELDGVALAHSHDRAGKPRFLAILHLEQSRFDGPGSDINSSRYGHGSIPSIWPECARRANSAAPSAPV